MLTGEPKQRRAELLRWLQVIIAVLIGTVCLVLFYRSNDDWGAVWASIQGANYVYLGIAVLLNLFSIYIRAWRWKSFLGEPKVDSLKLFHVGNVGFMGNGVLPARMGEFIRPYLVGRMTPHSFSAALATIVVERVFDLVTILAILAYALWVFPFAADAGPSAGADLQSTVKDYAKFGVIILVAALACVMVMSYAPHWTARAVRTLGKPLPHGLVDKIVEMIHAFEKGSSTFRRPRSFFYCLGMSLFLWMVITLGELYVLWAFGVTHIDFNGALFLMTALCFAVMSPQLPGFIGTYQIVVHLILTTAFLVDESTAGAVSIVMWATQVPPVIVMGFISLMVLGVSFHDITHMKESMPEEKAPESKPDST